MHFLSSFLAGTSILVSSWVGLSHNQLMYTANSATTGSEATSSKTIYLTLDLDMNESMYRKIKTMGKVWYDPAVFSYLEQNHIPATFFVSGLFAVAYPDLMHNLASGSQFEFENHSYDESSFVPHCYWLKTLTTDKEKIQQIQETEQIIKKDTGQTTTYFRFPGACTDSRNNAFVKSLGYTINDGTDIAGDPFDKNANAIVRSVLSNATNSGTVLMHVGGPNAPESLIVLEQIVPELKAKGYQFAKL